MLTSTSFKALLFTFLQLASGDVSHFFAPDLTYFQHHHHVQPPQNLQQQQIPVVLQPPLQAVYGPPSAVYGPPPQVAGYPFPAAPSPIATPAPVAPIVAASATTEFTLPEIVENRRAKDERQFIPLLKQYLPPTEDRPSYESPKPGDQDYNPFPGYSYNKPTTTTTSTTTTTENPPPIIVEDPQRPVYQPPSNNPEVIPAIDNDGIAKPPFAAPPFQGYDYNAPSPVIPQDDTPIFKPSTPAPVYLPVAPNGQNEETLIQNTDPSLPPLRLKIHEMRCLQQANRGGYFRSVLKVDSFIGAPPTVDNDSSDKRCELKLHKSYVVVDVAGEDFNTCGVQPCGSDLCLRLRFPALRGMRTGADSILTLHCKTQSRVAVKTHALKMGVANEVQSRSIGTYAKGGMQNSFRTHVEILRKTPQGYARHLRSNEAVQLGEDLLLRAHVLTGDGWNYTKLSDVSLQRISPSGEVLNNVNLISPQGCLNPSMKGICTQPPSYDAPLGYKLPFKAVMFQGMRSGDELIMSMRITGCLDYHECQVREEECSNGNIKRRKRDLNAYPNNNNTEISEISTISFKVVMPEDVQTNGTYHYLGTWGLEPNTLILCSTLGLVGLLIALGLCVVLKLRK